MTWSSETSTPGDAIRDHLLAVGQIPGETRRRMTPHLYESVPLAKVGDYLEDGWVVDKELKTRTRMRKEKTHDRAFEDRVWATFAKLQFTHLNRDRTFKLQYGKEVNQAKQIDVFAADDEVVLVIECKSTRKVRAEQFKKEIEAISGRRAGIIRRVQAEYPKHKIKFVLATNNFSLSKATQERLNSEEIFHLDEETIAYYQILAEHLGSAARYQLLGALFANQKIPNLDPKVPAIRGSMGGHTYFSFSIEPARLLKMAYVLHRNQANSDLMPTYQRLIKKSRLRKVASFVEGGGYFPNSIILNIETGKRGLQFDLVARDAQGPGAAKLGLLHLPKTYRAAYVIDGQHRLYGYANSSRADTELIPVVAFVDLDRSDQIRLFMQINENQQAVPKNLRNTLNSDLLWESEDYRERARALRLHIAQHLGEQKSSPLFDRILVGENPRTNLRSITIEAISNGLARGNFIGDFSRTQVTTRGSFYAGDNAPTASILIPFLEAAFTYLSEMLPAQWALGSAEGGFVFINNGVEAYLRLLSDVVDHVVESAGVDPLTWSASEVLSACTYYIDPLIDHLESLDANQGAEYRRLYGSGAGLRYYRRLQEAVREARPEFNPPGLDAWLKAQDRASNNQAREIVDDLERFFKRDIRARLQDEYGDDWERLGLPKKLRGEIAHRATAENLELTEGPNREPWDMMYLIEYRDVVCQNNALWTRRFEKRYTRPGDESKKGGWKARSSWMTDLNDIRNSLSHARGITEEQFAFLADLRSWLLLGEIDNDL